MDFSIIVPTRQRPAEMASCLDCLAGLRYPRERFEVIVVEDGSDTTLEPSLSVACGLTVRVLEQQHGGPAAARNLGAAHARGTYLAFTDDDCRPAPDWLEAFERRLASAPDRVVGGRTLTCLRDNPYAAASQCQVSYLYEYYNRDPNEARFLASNNMAVPHDLFDEIGGFDAKWPLAAAEDREFSDRWLRSGHHMIYAPEVVVHHAHVLTLRTFWKQHYNYGRGAYYFQRARRGRHQGKFEFEPAGFYWNLICRPLSEKPIHRGFLLAGLQAVSQMAAAAGFIRQWIGGPP